MGKGDRKTKKGKIRLGSFGVSRPKKKEQAAPIKKKAKTSSSKAKTAKKTKK